MKEPSNSVAAQGWKRLKKNKPAMAGFIIIVFVMLLAIFGYMIVPDNSPDADLQTIEIQAKKPGYTQMFLLIPETGNTRPNPIEEWFMGKKSTSRYLPITGYEIKGKELIVSKYIDEDTTIKQVYSIDLLTGNKPGNISSQIVTKKYWLGTDTFGRDMLSRLVVGARVSLAVGFIAVLVSLILGILLGALAGYYRGWIDEVIMWFVNVTWSIPTLLLVFAVTIAMGKGFWQIFIAVGLTMWVSVARLVRGQVLALKELEFVQAARALGYKDGRIIFRHIIPNMLGPLMVIAAGNFATAIIIEAGLSFLGIGVQAPQPSWGLMIKENYHFIITHNPLMALLPGFAIMILVLSFNLLGNGLRDALDVKD